ncbi:MAG TPA: hypothetical protein PLN96_09775 [Zoogloea sp.]|uniref:hypothetical protein n=1 Tax=Zoogloea sp. TaxID=49181 RepID=UPI002C28E124|nr:hypothetical protein [Zoogloea sp.]HMV16835.1 hypothetical protein [Rhodocyclaceae bacterium]HMV62725.1 hypothetical protein [Rhodocyclaceae bacterium]HMY49237.1 hypothetical protein [Rhodocyclaceae bacterium]HMZ75165.1 hypothetical protein [Rhodocyclaceae bacterium]HNA67101.1 hypothetical protein [Rhodocyclaceae bacterium]
MHGERGVALGIVATIMLGLAADRFGGPWGQPLVSVWTWLFLGALLWRAPALRRPLLGCLLIATTGEIVLSLVLHLYDYRLGNLPLFVPPGHCLLYWLGLYVAPRLGRHLTTAIPWAAVGGVSILAVSGLDGLGPLLLALFLLCLRYGPAPRLYVSMFALSLLMELWGTALGCWTWRSTLPLVDWPVTNPPLAAGAFYCVLDLLCGSLRHPQTCHSA